LVSGILKTGSIGGYMDLEIKKKARFAFLPRLIEIAGEDRKELAYMLEIGKSLHIDRTQIEDIEKYLISEKLIRASQHGGIISVERTGKAVAYSSFPRVVTEIWSQTIFTVFDNKELKTEIEKWAGENGYQITIGESIFDIVFIPFFVCVIDRRLLGKEAWDLYLEVREINNTDQSYASLFKACIIVDGIRDKMALPEYDPVFCFDLRHKHSIPLMKKSIEIVKEIVDNR
jgi:hypothetical protein